MAKIEILNDGAIGIIDDTYANMILSHKFTASTNQQSLDQNYWLGEFSVAIIGTEWPLIAISSNVPVGLNWTFYANGGYTYRVISKTQATFTVYAFNIPKNLQDLNGNVRLWNGSGQLRFDSNHNYLRTIDLFYLSIGPDQSRTYTAGRTYAATLMGRSFSSSRTVGDISNPPFDAWTTFTVATVGVSGNIITTSTAGSSTLEFGSSTDPTTYAFDGGPAPIMVIDVTNY